MAKYSVAYVSTLLVLLIGDFAWLSVMGSVFYRPTLRDVMLEKFRLAPAIAFYLLYSMGVVFFAVAPALDHRSWMMALTQGAFLGSIAYGTYDLTNMASLRNWTIQLTAVDMAWGAALTAVASTVGLLSARAVTS